MGGAKSAWCEVMRGVLKGSILGPLLFTLFMNDLPNVIGNCSVDLCADDTAIYFLEVHKVLEAELRTIAHWIERTG